MQTVSQAWQPKVLSTRKDPTQSKCTTTKTFCYCTWPAVCACAGVFHEEYSEESLRYGYLKYIIRSGAKSMLAYIYGKFPNICYFPCSIINLFLIQIMAVIPRKRVRTVYYCFCILRAVWTAFTCAVLSYSWYVCSRKRTCRDIIKTRWANNSPHQVYQKIKAVTTGANVSVHIE